MNNRKLWIWGGVLLGILWSIIGYVSSLSRWGDVPDYNYLMFLGEGGFFSVLAPIALGLFIYFRYYILSSFLILGFLSAIIFSLSSKDITGVVLPGVVILGLIAGVIAEILFRAFHKVS